MLALTRSACNFIAMEAKYAHRVAANVRAELARHQISQASVADKLHVSRTFVHRRMKGDVPFDVNELYAISQLAGVPVETLIHVENAKQKQTAA